MDFIQSINTFIGPIAAFLGFCTVIIGAFFAITKHPFKKFKSFIQKTAAESDSISCINNRVDKLNNIKEERDRQLDNIGFELKTLNELIIRQNEQLALMKQTQEEFNNQHKLIIDAQLGLLRDNISRMYHKYTELKWLPHYEKERIVRDFEHYKALGGNSFTETMYNALIILPNTPTGTDRRNPQN